MSIAYGVASRVLNDGVTYWFITLDGQIPSSATRYKTPHGAKNAAKLRQVREQAKQRSQPTNRFQVHKVDDVTFVVRDSVTGEEICTVTDYAKADGEWTNDAEHRARAIAARFIAI